MARVVPQAAKGIRKYGDGLAEGDTMFADVVGGLAGIPFEGQGHGANLRPSPGIRITPYLTCERIQESDGVGRRHPQLARQVQRTLDSSAPRAHPTFRYRPLDSCVAYSVSKSATRASSSAMPSSSSLGSDMSMPRDCLSASAGAARYPVRRSSRYRDAKRAGSRENRAKNFNER